MVVQRVELVHGAHPRPLRPNGLHRFFLAGIGPKLPFHRLLSWIDKGRFSPLCANSQFIDDTLDRDQEDALETVVQFKLSASKCVCISIG